MALILTTLAGIPLIHPGDNLAIILAEAIEKTAIRLQDGDIIVLAQKIVSKAEGRIVNLTGVQPSPRAFELAKETDKDPRFIELVLQESQAVLRTRSGTIIVKHRRGFVCANAGIDHSNVEGVDGSRSNDWVLLLPENPDRSAQAIRALLQKQYNICMGIMIIDSHGRAWRMGTVGVAIGLAGMPGLVDLRGTEDLFGYKLAVTQVAAADELAAAASLIMGQAAEMTPAVHVRGFPYPLREGNLAELIRPHDLDLFR